MKTRLAAVLMLCAAPLVAGCSHSKESLVVKSKKDRQRLRTPEPRNEPAGRPPPPERGQ
jgi:hypothetical protein